MLLRDIVKNYIYSKDSSIHDFARLYNLASWGIKTEFNLDVWGGIKTVLLDVNANKTAELPCDYIGFSKIGVTNGKGEFVCFKRNEQLTEYHSEYFQTNSRTAGVPTINNFEQLSVNGDTLFDYNNFLFLNYAYSGTSFNLFGLGSGTVDYGEYKINERSKIITFNPYFQYDNVLLEYLSDCSDEETGDYEVDVRAAEAVKCYVRWQDAIDIRKKYSQGTILSLKREFYNQKRLAKMRINKLVPNEIANAERRSWKLAAKA